MTNIDRFEVRGYNNGQPNKAVELFCHDCPLLVHRTHGQSDRMLSELLVVASQHNIEAHAEAEPAPSQVEVLDSAGTVVATYEDSPLQVGDLVQPAWDGFRRSVAEVSDDGSHVRLHTGDNRVLWPTWFPAKNYWKVRK